MPGDNADTDRKEAEEKIATASNLGDAGTEAILQEIVQNSADVNAEETSVSIATETDISEANGVEVQPEEVLSGDNDTVETTVASSTDIMTEIEASSYNSEDEETGGANAETAVYEGWHQVTSEDTGYAIFLKIPEDAQIPVNARFEAAVISADNANYVSYMDRAMALVKSACDSDDLKLLCMFDLTIYDENNNIVQPKAPVQVAVQFDDSIILNGQAYAIHFPSSEAKVQESALKSETRSSLKKSASKMLLAADRTDSASENSLTEPELVEASVRDQAIVFDAGGFSVYAIVGTTIE
ncbi:MAG: hypothetical protein J6A79_06705 [Clostridia bacterium]|nr:hypothetical protein [Clostridia bacterium]